MYHFEAYQGLCLIIRWVYVFHILHLRRIWLKVVNGLKLGKEMISALKATWTVITVWKYVFKHESIRNASDMYVSLTYLHFYPLGTNAMSLV